LVVENLVFALHCGTSCFDFSWSAVLAYIGYVKSNVIGVGSGAAGAAVVAPIFWLVAVLGPWFLNTRVVCFITKTQTLSENGICKLETIEHLCYI